MNIPVYESHDGIAYDDFNITVTGELTPTRDGISGRIDRVTLRKVTGRGRGYMLRSLPANYKTLTQEQAIKALEACKYNFECVSLQGTALLKHFNLPDKQYGVNHG